MLTNGTTYQTANRLDRFVGFELLVRRFYLLLRILSFLQDSSILFLLEHRCIGWLSPNLNEREIRADMTKYEKAMLVIAILTLLIDALALFKYFL